MDTLKLALIHLSVHHKKPEHNRKMLVGLVTEAAIQGAGIVVGPELAVSGYAFDSRNDVEPYTETQTGPTLTALAELARSFGIYLCMGMAERDSRTGIIYNSAFVLDPNGRIACRYRKINAESRWACPGDPKQDNTFETPWGRVGILICSDSYHGLMPRVTALRGADLLIVPANWPPAGLDPRELWRARALENGYYVAGCNRTGMDLTMDCRHAPTGVWDPLGRMMLDVENDTSQVFWVDLPLSSNGLLDNRIRKKRLADRRPQYYHDCYLNLRSVKDLTGFLDLPQPGDLNLYCIVPDENEHPADAFTRNITRNAAPESLYVLPPFDYSDAAHEKIAQTARTYHTSILTCNPDLNGQRRYTFYNQGKQQQWEMPLRPFDNITDIPRIDFGPARLILVHFDALTHPELGLAAAKQGCDLAISLENRMTADMTLLAGVRTIENLDVALCAPNGAGIWMTPDGHQRWEEVLAGNGRTCHYRLDTHRSRQKSFQDRIDFDVLLDGNSTL